MAQQQTPVFCSRDWILGRNVTADWLNQYLTICFLSRSGLQCWLTWQRRPGSQRRSSTRYLGSLVTQSREPCTPSPASLYPRGPSTRPRSAAQPLLQDVLFRLNVYVPTGGRSSSWHVLLHAPVGGGGNLSGTRKWLRTERRNLPFQVLALNLNQFCTHIAQ